MSRLTERQVAIRDLTRGFVAKEIAPHALEWDRTASVPLETVRQAGGLGLFGVNIPSELGGTGADFTSYVLAMEELAYGDAGVCNMITDPTPSPSSCATSARHRNWKNSCARSPPAGTSPAWC